MSNRKGLIRKRFGSAVYPSRGQSDSHPRLFLDVYDGETLAIVGESRSGKSVFTKCFVGMLDRNGAITNGDRYKGQDLAGYKSEAQWRTIRGGRLPW